MCPLRHSFPGQAPGRPLSGPGSCGSLCSCVRFHFVSFGRTCAESAFADLRRNIRLTGLCPAVKPGHPSCAASPESTRFPWPCPGPCRGDHLRPGGHSPHGRPHDTRSPCKDPCLMPGCLSSGGPKKQAVRRSSAGQIQKDGVRRADPDEQSQGPHSVPEPPADKVPGSCLYCQGKEPVFREKPLVHRHRSLPAASPFVRPRVPFPGPVQPRLEAAGQEKRGFSC